MDTKKLIKFYATWCGPCKVYSKTWSKVVPSYKDQMDIKEVDIDSDTAGLAAKYKVESVPTTVLIKEDGSMIKKVGRLSQDQLTELVLS
tara:strand:+ start:356 stop:622 length:267 start_codon:yes stop_codon:yes gene_type:complete